MWFVYRIVRRSKKNANNERILKIKIGSHLDTSRHDNTSQTSDKDEWEGSFWEVVRPTPVAAHLQLSYTDGSGKYTERTVQIRKFGMYVDSVLLIGHCELRNATRTFRTDRISQCVNKETGEVIADVTEFLTNKYKQSPQKTKDSLLEEEYDLLRVLLYVGKADGQLRAEEKRVILETCVALTADSRLSDKDIDQMFTEMDVPTLHAFKLAVGRIAKRGATHASVVLAASERMVATQKTSHATEIEALEYMRKRFEEIESH